MTQVRQQHRAVSAIPSWRTWTWLGIGAFTLLLAAPFMLRPPCPDVATFDYVGWLASRGETLYVDVIEQNFPGVMWLHTLATLLFGNHVWSFRVLDFALMLVGCAGLFRLATLGALAPTRYLVVPLYQVIYATSDVWMTGQRDILASHVMLVSGALAVTRMRGGPSYLPLLVGATMAFASLTRPTFVLYLPLLFLSDALTRDERRTLSLVARDVVSAGLAYAGVLGSIALLGLYTGALNGWYNAAIVFNTMLYSQTATLWDMLKIVVSTLRLHHWLTLLAAFGVARWIPRGERRVLLVTLSLALTGVVSAFAQGKGLGYHLAPLYPALCLLAADGMASAIERAGQRVTRLDRPVAVFLCAVAVLGSARKLHTQYRDSARYLLGHIDRERLNDISDIGFAEVLMLGDVTRAVDYARAHTTPEQTVLPWNRVVMINYLAERRLPTPLATVGMLDLLRDGFPTGRVWMQTFAHTLRHDPPALVFTFNERAPEDYARLWTPDPDLPATALVREALTTRYRRVARFGPLDAYALQ